MAVNIGPKIGIDGDAQFRKELNNIIQQAKTLESEMKAVSSSFDENTDSQEKLEAQAKILNQQIEVQDQRIEMLKKGVEAATKEFGKGSTEALKWEQALNEAKNTINGMKSDLSSLENGVEDVTEELEDGEKASFGFGDALKAGLLSNAIIDGVKNLGGKISDLTESTKEYRKIMGSLDVSSERAGYTAQETADIYKTLYGVLGDDQTAATTTANLQAIGLEQSKLIEITNAAIGAWATYGDSLPIDGLAESINETIKSGTVTGNFADVLNWASLEGETFGVKLKENTEANEEWNKAVEDATTAEDYFNLALQDAVDSTERANLVMDLLSSQGLPDAGKAWQDTNSDIVDANTATSEFQDITADLAKKFSPISTSLQKGFNKIASSASDMVDDSDIEEWTDIIEDASDFIADDVMPVIKNLFDFVLDNRKPIINAIEGIGAGFLTWKSAEVVSKVSGYIKDLTTSAKNAAGPIGILNGLWSANPAGVVATSVGLLVTAMGFLIGATEEQTEEEKLLQEQYEKRVESLENLKTSYENVKSSAFESAEAELDQIDYVEDLYNELNTLADSSGKVADKDKERADFIVNELNKALDTEYSLTGNQIDQYQTMQDEITKLIGLKKAEILLEAQEKAYTEAINSKQEAENDYYGFYKEYINKKKELDAEYEEYYKTVVATIGESNKEAVQDAIDAWYLSRSQDYAELEEKKAKYKEAENLIKEYNKTIQVYNQATEDLFAGNTQAVIDLLENQGLALTTATDLVGKSKEEQNAILKAQYEEALALLKDYEKDYKAGVEGTNEIGLETLRDFAERARVEMEKAGKSTAEGYANGIWESIDSIKAAAEAAANAVPNTIKSRLKIFSPSRVTKELGIYTGEGYENGVTESMKDAIASLKESLSLGSSMISGIEPFSVPAGYGNPSMYSSSSRSVSYGGFTINVNAAPGMDENAIAEVVASKIQTEIMQKEAVFR